MTQKEKLRKEILRTRRQLGIINDVLRRLQHTLRQENAHSLDPYDTGELLAILRSHQDCIVSDLIETQKDLEMPKETVQKCKQDATAAVRDSQRILYFVERSVES